VWDESGPAASFRNRPKDKPFFAVFNFFLTHELMITSRKDPLLVDPGTLTVPPIYPDTPVVRRDIARLFTNIEIADRQVGELVKTLKESDLYEDTIIFLYSDNGGNLPRMKREILEGGTHIPFIVRLPGSQHAGETNDELVSAVDFAPTVLSLAGVPIPAHMQGQALLGEQQAKTPRRYVFAARDRIDTEYDRVRMVRDARYRYLYNYVSEKPYYQKIEFRLKIPMMTEILQLRDQGKLDPVQSAWFNPKPAEELYDLEQDPHELDNLAGNPSYTDKLIELRTALHEWTRAYGDMGGIPEKDMIRQMWDGKNEPPMTATPEVIRENGGVRLDCATMGASIGYWIAPQRHSQGLASHPVQSWDYEILFGRAKNGDSRPAPPEWKVYGGEVIPLNEGEILHVNATRIGYQPAVVDYIDGKVIMRKAP
jgi:N-sulfoglucosamine sulfohydrolase